MGLQFILREECYIALGLTLHVGANVMRLGEVNLERGIVCVVHVLEVVSAQVACQMLTVYMVVELDVVEEEFLTEVAPWMR